MASLGHFTDLLLTIVAALAGLGGLWLFGPSVPALAIAFPLLILLPGYAFVSVLYPRNADVSTLGVAARLGLAVALSATMVPAVAIGLDSVTGIYPLPVVVVLAGLTVIGTLLALVRRLAVPVEERFHVGPAARLGFWYDRYLRGTRSLQAHTPLEARSGREVFFNLVVVVSILVFAASVGFAAVVPQGDSYSEAYLATTNGGSLTMVENGGSLSSAEREAMVAVVENHEGDSMQYTVEVVSQNVASDGSVTSSKVVTKQSKTLASGDTWKAPVPQVTGGSRTVINVYKNDGDDGSSPDYRLTFEEA